MTKVPPEGESVFVNVPFDRRYEPLFVALIATLTGLGATPRCVLEIRSRGQTRLQHLIDLIGQCSASIHDLSRVQRTRVGRLLAPRFNMPFELGIACSSAHHADHRFFLFEERPHRLQATLSDLNGHDPHIHGCTVPGIIRCVLGCFESSGRMTFAQAQQVADLLALLARRLKREAGAATIFEPYLFQSLVVGATEIAGNNGLLD